MESAISDVQMGQISPAMGAMGFKRPRGRPRIENPANKRGAARGARQGTIDRAKKLCQEAGLDFGDELERKLQELIAELAGPEALQQIVRELEEEQLQRMEHINQLKARINELTRQSAGPSDGFEQAIEHTVARLIAPDNRPNYIALLEPNARKLARDYPGHHWQTIKHTLKTRAEEEMGIAKKPGGETWTS